MLANICDCYITLQEQYWRIPADMTPSQLDEAVQSLQPVDCHDNSCIDQSGCDEAITGGHEEDAETPDVVTEETQQQDDTLADDGNTVAGDRGDDDDVHSDSSEQSGLCIDYQSDQEDEGMSCNTHMRTRLRAYI